MKYDKIYMEDVKATIGQHASETVKLIRCSKSVRRAKGFMTV